MQKKEDYQFRMPSAENKHTEQIEFYQELDIESKTSKDRDKTKFE